MTHAINIPRIAQLVKTIKPWTFTIFSVGSGDVAERFGFKRGYCPVHDFEGSGDTILGFGTFPEGSVFKIFNYHLKKTVEPRVTLILHHTTDSGFFESTPGGRKKKVVKVRFDVSLEDFSSGCLALMDEENEI